MGGDKIVLSSEIPNIIVAYTSKNRYIGKNNDLVWGRSLKGDFNFMKRVIRLEKKSAIVMGRNTFESMPRIPDLQQIVLTKNKEYLVEGAVVKESFDEALMYCRERGLIVIVFGGASVYKESLKYKCKIFSTIVEENGMEGDVAYPQDNAKLENITESVHDFLLKEGVKQTWSREADFFVENGIKYSFYLGYN